MTKVLARTAAVVMCLTLVLTLTGVRAGAESTEGCSVGFWKNHVSLWPSPYTSQTTFYDVFNGVGFDDASMIQILGTIPFPDQIIQWLSFTGGPSSDNGYLRILMRAFVASLLNAAHPSVHFGLSTSDVIIQTEYAVLGGGGRSAVLAQASRFDTLNNLGCPLE